MRELVKFLDKNMAELAMIKNELGLVETYFDKDIMFDHDNKTYLWQGDFSIALEFVTIDQTLSFSCLQDQSEVELTPKLEYVLRYEILNR